ncbi:DoxX family protein [Verrucosispora sp. WMMA2044]|uniref:DoxX family membrane protein n=1 Tax=Verrucosispora sioxanthis TaxID=2499994 RepID=A0A6M1KQN3_9ACTN|nr:MULTISPECIES: DoxX family membrane protein [Micromonospora]MCZ7420928.1 DoxX family protein [Verrucosispora sp. WMMA2121]NEE63138.1 DoxX family membrane protein [Verrucosispora sioxanthis]NGM12248.1 DoxX family membrane protein [Verrucosispora sioxanthis]WBB47640.1 DoxX family protein [Verrucosispora sp. WMMA2044]
MAPLIALVAGTGLARLVGLAGLSALDGWHPALRVGLALMFVMTGIVHFVGRRRQDLIAMVPPRLPRPDLLVTVTGVLELAGAVGLLVPATARWAAAGLALLLLAMFPANVSAARRRLTLAGRPVTPLGTRTALQLVFLAAAIAVAVGP